MKVQQTLTALLIISLSQCIPILKNEKDDSQAWLALLPLVQPSGSTGSQTCNPGVVPDFCTAAQADYGCSVYEGMDARLDGVFKRDIPVEILGFSALCRGFQRNGIYSGIYEKNSPQSMYLEPEHQGCALGTIDTGNFLLCNDVHVKQ